MEVVAWPGTAGNVAGGESGGGGFPVSDEQGTAGHGESRACARWDLGEVASELRTGPRPFGRRSIADDELRRSRVRARRGGGATAPETRGEERGKRRVLTLVL